MVLRYGPKSSGVSLAILILSTLDALLTLDLTTCGAMEVNTLMAFCLERSPGAFFWVKYLLTSAGVIFLLLIKDAFVFRTRLQVKAFLGVFLAFFTLVVIWELFLGLFFLW